MFAAEATMLETSVKLAAVRSVLAANGLTAVRLRGSDWFAWISGGGSSVVLMTQEVGVAEVLITGRDAWVLTDTIEAERLAAEEVPEALPIWSHPWAAPGRREEFVRRCCEGGMVASDRPTGVEVALPPTLVHARWSLGEAEIERYRGLGGAAARAMTEALAAARPEWTERALAGAAAEALWSRGIEPALILAAGERRLPLFRHPLPTAARLEGRAMLVLCARRHGLVASLTRHVYFRTPGREERAAMVAVARVEAEALETSRPGTPLSAVYAAIASAYAREGYPHGEAGHHQGGPCGYAAREAIARPGVSLTIAEDGAVAYNPSLPGVKIEDTALVRAGGVEFLTVDPGWPKVQVGGRGRPDVLLR